jgi:hypothetical protein
MLIPVFGLADLTTEAASSMLLRFGSSKLPALFSTAAAPRPAAIRYDAEM